MKIKNTFFYSLPLLVSSLSYAHTAEPEITRIQPIVATKALDLTHVLHDDMVVWPGGVPFKKTPLATHEKDGYLLHKFSMGENTGTHVDAPAHYIKGNKTLENLSIDQLILPMVVIDVTTKVQKNSDYELTVDDIKQWEKEYGPIPANSLVVLNTGWSKKFESTEQYQNMDQHNIMHFPGYSPNAAKYLVSLHVSGIGIDTFSLDNGSSTTFETHRVMLKANKFQIENMANLSKLPTTGATAVIGVLPVQGGSQAQARVFALLP
ncbi:TPA: cyclase family protein [Photobacterium damselae]